jgi:hypothetical protein
MTFARGAHGWTYTDDVEGGGELFIRFDDRGRAVELYLTKTDGEISPTDLRRLPLTAMRSRVVGRGDIALTISRSHGPEDKQVDLRTQVEGAFFDGDLDAEAAGSSPPFELTPRSSTEGLTDRFLQEVACAYRDALARGLRPNIALAEQTQAPKRTVERWVWLARKAGHLEPTRPGRVG